MKIKNKGKVYPSPSSSSSASHSSDEQVLSVLKLLPATIIALASLLSVEDREVLVYMITRSVETTPTSSIVQATKKNSSNSKRTIPTNNTHKPPVFDCDCFDCYTSYWFRWDSSPNRELIHQVIEAFEDHLTNGDKSKKNAPRPKKKERMTSRVVNASPQNKITSPETSAPDMDDNVESQDGQPSPSISPRPVEDDATAMNVEPQPVNTQLTDEELKLVFRGSAVSNHRGLARKVLPDVLGLLNSRLWSFWSPSV
ncbi:hypothetical protein L6164_010768 [Bauhinia variegata]|uniref:Uncharacterized protein n=1 Tax=Bauhinia variegata TaxID=167791 RepID=A0ACB9P3S0_BAUVA|nr:hypothetical protein L6164_010768 [Bauhinia variegata]